MDKREIITINRQYRTRAAIEAAPTSDFIPLPSTGRRMCTFHPIPIKYVEMLDPHELTDVRAHIDDAIELRKHMADNVLFAYMQAASGTLGFIEEVSRTKYEARFFSQSPPDNRPEYEAFIKSGSRKNLPSSSDDDAPTAGNYRYARDSTRQSSRKHYSSSRDQPDLKELLKSMAEEDKVKEDKAKARGKTYPKHSAPHAKEDMRSRRPTESARRDDRRGSTRYPKVQPHHAFESTHPYSPSMPSQPSRSSRVNYPPPLPAHARGPSTGNPYANHSTYAPTSPSPHEYGRSAHGRNSAPRDPYTHRTPSQTYYPNSPAYEEWAVAQRRFRAEGVETKREIWDSKYDRPWDGKWEGEEDWEGCQ